MIDRSAWLIGSSPLARGTLVVAKGTGFCRRLIPARAGNTPRRWNPAGCPAAHPRSRGEHLVEAHNTALDSGSSPLARGTLHAGSHRPPERRLIPARAGNTSAGDGEPVPVTAHPRSRGEHVAGAFGDGPWVGSSPLARGTPRSGLSPPGLSRLIPARAGNTHMREDGDAFLTAHPRSRGEHRSLSPFERRQAGSSPLARGTPPAWFAGALCCRLIPARAGNTSTSSQAPLV